MNPLCIACDSQETTLVGKLPVFTPDYLDQSWAETVDAGFLYRCEQCSLLFRWPMPSPEALLIYYRGLDKDERWHVDSEREVWTYVGNELADVPIPSVLDVGCFRGNMLRQIGSELSCFGVEPSPSARRESEAHGITIIGDSIDSLRSEKRRFGAITLIDVAEHLPRPLERDPRGLRRAAPAGAHPRDPLRDPGRGGGHEPDLHTARARAAARPLLGLV